MGSGWWGTLSSLLGVVTVVIMIVSHVSRRRLFRRAAISLAGVGRELGLEHVPSSFANGQGSLRGTYAGVAVRVDPDEGQTVGVRFATQPRVDLRSYAIAAPVSFDMQEFHAPDAAFNRFWKVRRATPELADELVERASADWVEPLARGKYARNVKSVTVTADGVSCELNFGAPPHIPPDAVPALLKACVSLAARIEPNPHTPLERLVADALCANRPDPDASGARGALQAFVARRFGPVLAATAALAAVLKLWLAASTYGTSDVSALERFATWSRFLGSDLYLHDAAFQRPPLQLPLLRALDGLASATGVGFSFWLRGLATLADALTLLLVYRLAAPRLGEGRTRSGLLLLAASPLLLLVSGFHGSTDPVMIALLLLSVYLTERRGNDALSGAALGLASCAHPLPLLALPVLIACRSGWQRRLAFGAAVAAVAVPCFVLLASPHLRPALASLMASPGAFGRWGLSWLATALFGADALPSTALRAGGGALVPFAVAALSLALVRRAAPAGPYARVGIIVGACLACTSTFGVQQLAWLAPWMVGLPLLLPLCFTLASAALLAVVYSDGSGGLPRFFADGSGVGDAGGHAVYFHLVCWAAVLLCVWSAWQEARPEGQPASAAPPALRRPAFAWAAALLLALPAVLHLRGEASTPAPDAAAALAALRARPLIQLSALLIEHGRYDDGIVVARRATAVDPTQPIAWNNLAAGHSSKSEWDAAIIAAERAVRLDPSFQLARNNLRWARDQKARASNAGPPGLVRPL